MNIHFLFRFRKQEIEHLLAQTDSFTWEELPNRDPETGHMTKAGYIPLTQKIATHVPALITISHAIQTCVRIWTSHDTVLPAWFPFDTSVSPAYEIVNLIQVNT
jgi:hypothetical protein